MFKLLADAAAATVAAQTAVDLADISPFLQGRVVKAGITLSGATGTNPSIKIQSSPDNSTWTDCLVCAALGDKFGNITLDRYMRATVITAAGTTPGVYSAYIDAD